MECDTPPPPPPADILANRLANRAWDDDIRDDDRLLMEHAAETIRAQATKNNQLTQRAEHLEAYCQTLMAQKGGAS